MSCPVHIWIPLMAAAVPFTRAIRARLLLRRVRPHDPAHSTEVVRRWAPIAERTNAKGSERPS